MSYFNGYQVGEVLISCYGNHSVVVVALIAILVALAGTR